MSTTNSRFRRFSLLVAGLLPSLAMTGAALAAELTLRSVAAGTELLLGETAFHQTAAAVVDTRLIEVPDSDLRLAVWRERDPAGETVPFYAVSLDGRRVDTVRETSYDLLLRYGRFDARKDPAQVASGLAAGDGARLFIVQLVSQPLAELRRGIEDAGARVLYYLAHHAYIVEMSAAERAQVAGLPFVRWVGPYHPAYKLEEGLAEAVLEPVPSLPTRRYHIQVTGGGEAAKTVVAARVRELGGVVDGLRGSGPLLDVTLTPRQLRRIVHLDEVFFVDRWLPPRSYMDNVRIDGGADAVESVAGFTGNGVRAEVMDTGLRTDHQAWQHPPIIHGTNNGSQSHGTSVFGIVFGDGTGNPAGRGLLPDAQGIFAQSSFADRAGHIGELVQDPYFAVFQTNSWGSCCTTQYTTESMEIDQIIFDNDIVILQAQANEGSQNSDVSAWAKNNVSVGGIRHFDTLTRSDDAWNNAGSIGPAEDGRVKPDLAYWYDSILTTSSSGGYTGFGGTSAATPTTAGHFGLMFEMWSAGIFGNSITEGGTVFDNRPHATTAKALMINTTRPYDFSGEEHDLTRVHQGWGLPNVENLYNSQGSLFVVDETDVLSNLDSTTYEITVTADTPALKATLVYLDPAGTTSSSQHRINDLTLEVTSPSAVTYFGNNGLLAGNESVAGGSPNTIDTVENVWVQNPEAGIWSIKVRADEINEDSHVETGAIDADYALVVSGGSPGLFADGFESGDTSAWSQSFP